MQHPYLRDWLPPRGLQRMTKKIEDCPICGEYIDIAVKGFSSEPFVTGKTYETICYTCACVARSSFVMRLSKDEEYKKELLNSLEEMLSEGFNKKRSEASIKNIKKLSTLI